MALSNVEWKLYITSTFSSLPIILLNSFNLTLYFVNFVFKMWTLTITIALDAICCRPQLCYDQGKKGDINLLELKDEDNPKFNEFIDSATYQKKKKINIGEDGNKIAIKNTLVMNMA